MTNLFTQVGILAIQFHPESVMSILRYLLLSFSKDRLALIWWIPYFCRFYAGKAGSDNFTMRPYRVTEAAFHSCDTTGGQPITDTYTSDVITVRSEFLEAGHNYFIGTTWHMSTFLRRKFPCNTKPSIWIFQGNFHMVYISCSLYQHIIHYRQDKEMKFS